MVLSLHFPEHLLFTFSFSCREITLYYQFKDYGLKTINITTYLFVISKLLELHLLLKSLSSIFPSQNFTILCFLFHLLVKLFVEVNHLFVHQFGEIIPLPLSLSLLLLLSFELLVNFQALQTKLLLFSPLLFLGFVILETGKNTPLIHFITKFYVFVTIWRW